MSHFSPACPTLGRPSMIHSSLKRNTRDFHNALVTKVSVMLSDEISLDQFAAVQKKSYGFYSPIQMRLFSIRVRDGSEFKLQNRPKVPLLVGFLAARVVDLEEFVRLRFCDSLPRLETVTEALGCLYVSEGATLGGKIIIGHLKKVLPLDESRGFSFSNNYGDEFGRMWSSFLGIVSRHCERHGEGDVVVHSACQTLAFLDRWLADAACIAIRRRLPSKRRG